MVLDGKQKMDVKVEVQVDVAAQNFQLTVVEVGAPPTEQLVTRAHSTVTGVLVITAEAPQTARRADVCARRGSQTRSRCKSDRSVRPSEFANPTRVDFRFARSTQG